MAMATKAKIKFPQHEPEVRISKSGYKFKISDNIWKISPNEYINMSALPASVDYEVISGMVLTLARMAEEVSPSHVKNCSYYFIHYFLETPHYTGGCINGVDILNLKASLSREDEYKLGTIRALFRNWLDWGYPGLHRDLEALLNSLTLRGNVKGKAVLSNCPYAGPFTVTEQQILLNWAANAFATDLLTLREYAWFYLCYGTARRLSQLTSLRIRDLKVKLREGKKEYSIDIPRAKKRGDEGGFRKSFRNLVVTEDLFMILINLAETVKKNALRHISGLNADDLGELPIFVKKRWHLNVNNATSLRKMLREKPQELHLTRFSAVQISSDISKKCDAVSERTGEYIHFTPSRCRRTRATNLVRHGITGVQLAYLLDHEDTQNINVYTSYTPELALRIFAKMNEAMSFLALKFEGRLIAKESEAIRGDDPSSRVHKKGFEHVGNCGGSPTCQSGIKTCVVCVRFQPLLNAPWSELLGEMISELEERHKQGASELVLQSYDLAIAHVSAIMRACEMQLSKRVDISL
ncbi:phage integrase family protein [Halomonas alkaliantarctica]|nr:phage integrase family protein [Halomonas alkaliantarctica]